ncbi:excalibur calcium-binding domain-containing protein [Paenactinomyces guangxiensis]|uniref:Excalibur calcium-binding domain-containing protein n=1 Tax=Paenactinomyces guangxiensis TaxID=1490290 RepID=A0A7W2AAJ3_9BACL|nr:excalibur calcium-binding domain-containing protein [Paenactinomyces guangxiensis]MBA4496322.1 excalibur calcium-binding domain-containing protein [Paenactinomyces guangxiensis]MBH8590851.1 excalibur calcium-binding domain-containing protein [Paenactinomyces guangxiensis]
MSALLVFLGLLLILLSIVFLILTINPKRMVQPIIKNKFTVKRLHTILSSLGCFILALILLIIGAVTSPDFGKELEAQQEQDQEKEKKEEEAKKLAEQKKLEEEKKRLEEEKRKKEALAKEEAEKQAAEERKKQEEVAKAKTDQQTSSSSSSSGNSSSASSKPPYKGTDVTCSDFSTSEEATAYMKAYNVTKLDRDKNGVACESLK